MDIKLIALDLDGTLLDSKKNLSARNKEIIVECLKRGIYIVPNTGRTVIGIPGEILSIPGIRYAITTNGAVILDLQEDHVIDSRKLTTQKALELLLLADQQQAMYDCYIEGRGVSESKFLDHLDKYRISPELKDLVQKTRDLVPSILEYVKSYEGQIEKVNMFFADESERLEMRKKLAEVSDIIVSSSMPNNLEINAVGATKGEGILRLAEYLGLKPEQTMAFGDGENDFNMIQMAGCGVVMDNGDPELKKYADYITTSNDQDGVAEAIEKLVFDKISEDLS